MKMEPLLGEVLITDDSLIYFFEDHGVIIESMTSNKMSIVVNHTIGFVEYRQFQDDEFYFWAPPNFIMMIRYATEHGDTIWQSDINEVTVGFSENDKHISKMIFQYNESLGIEVYEDYVKGSTYRFLLKPGECENLNFPSIQFLESDSLVLPEEISHYSYRINKH
ncbi:hypothetical protein [Owenweeksia hongkongensis]|nr:hypothetical protein [Owenweeksia hongkongensis]